MTHSRDPYSYSMQNGESALHRGSLDDALHSFTQAYSLSIGNGEKAVAAQHMGIATRMMGKFVDARVHFHAAVALAEGNHALVAGIQNDLAMNFMEHGDSLHHGPARNGLFQHAERNLIEARDTFRVCGMPTSAAVSEGFLARLQLFRGRTNDARYSFIDVDRALQAGDNRNFELDNLMWYIGIANPKVRPGLVRRARKLIATTGQDRRLTQLRLVQLGINPITLLHAKRFVKRIFGK